MLKLKIFIWRFKNQPNLQQNIYSKYISARTETNSLYPHYQSLMINQNTKKSRLNQMIESVKKESKETVTTMIKTIGNVPIPKRPTKESFFQFLKLYNESIQALLEGKRETVTNASFKFADGETIDQKISRIENKIKSIIR